MKLTESQIKSIIKGYLFEDIVGATAKAVGGQVKKSTVSGAVSTGIIGDTIEDMQLISDSISKYLGVKRVKWTKNEIKALIKNPKMKKVFEGLASKLDYIDDLLSKPGAARALKMASSVSSTIILFAALPTAILMTLQNLSSAEGMLRNHYDKQPDHLKPVSYDNLADEFEPRSLIRRVSGASGRDHVILILAAEMIDNDDKQSKEPYIAQRLLKDKIIDVDFYTRVRDKKRDLLDRSINMKAIEMTSKSAKEPHKAIMLGLVCNLLKGAGVNIGGFIDADTIVAATAAATGFQG